jgi:HEAT repeat protein
MARALVLVALALACSRPDPYALTIDLRGTIKALGSGDLSEREAALERVAAVGAEALPALRTALATEPPTVRLGAIEGIARLATTDGDAVLREAATHDTDPEVRAEALAALGDSGDTQATGLVESALFDPNDAIRYAAIKACAPLCTSQQAADRLVELAIYDRPEANALWAHHALSRMMADPTPPRAEHARAAITAHALPLVGDAIGEQRARAALLGSDLGDPSATEVLADAVQHLDNTLLRLQGVYALGTAGGASQVPVLGRLLGAPSVSPYAYDALRRMAARGVTDAARVMEGYHGPHPNGPIPPPG